MVVIGADFQITPGVAALKARVEERTDISGQIHVRIGKPFVRHVLQRRLRLVQVLTSTIGCRELLVRGLKARGVDPLGVPVAVVARPGCGALVRETQIIARHRGGGRGADR